MTAFQPKDHTHRPDSQVKGATWKLAKVIRDDIASDVGRHEDKMFALGMKEIIDESAERN